MKPGPNPRIQHAACRISVMWKLSLFLRGAAGIGGIGAVLVRSRGTKGSLARRSWPTASS